MTRLPLLVTALTGLTAAVAAPGRAADDAAGFKPLFNGRDFTGWTIYLRDNADPAKTFSIKDGVISVTGKPNGYMITDKEYGDYVLRLKWRFPGAPGNSGVFVHVTGPNKIWPRGVEAQLFASRAGDFWLVDGYKMTIASARDPNSERHYARIGDKFVKKDGQTKSGRTQYDIVGKKVEKPLGEWNQYEITCKGDTIKLVVNGEFVNEGTNAESTKGKILLQSEGSPIEFKDIQIKLLK